MDFVTHISVGISRSKQTGEENSAIITCSPSFLVKEQQVEVRSMGY